MALSLTDAAWAVALFEEGHSQCCVPVEDS